MKKEKRKKEEYWVVMFSSFSEKTCNFFFNEKLLGNYWLDLDFDFNLVVLVCYGLF